MNNSSTDRLKSASKEAVDCLVCKQDKYKILGIRGNREHTGADSAATPHLFTNVVECRNCGFIYTNPQIKGVEFLEREHYDNPNEYQAEADASLPEMYQHRVDYIRRFKNGGSLLDVGAAKGDFVRKASENNFDACGVEPSPRFTEFANSRNGALVYNGNLDQCSPLRGRKFDVVTMHHVLEHVEEPHELLETLKDHMNPGGILYIEVPNTHSLTSKVIDLYFKLRGLGWSGRLSPLHPPFHKFGYNPKSLAFLLQRHGFEVTEMTTFSAFSRGFGKTSGGKAAALARSVVIGVVDLLGNRDMLVTIAKQANQ
jgi:SAM-dependent methyltransferase